jgi:hypothetical protein
MKAERWFHNGGLAIHTGVRRLGVGRSGDPPFLLLAISQQSRDGLRRRTMTTRRRITTALPRKNRQWILN